MSKRNLSKSKKGAALLEFAILSTILIPLLLYITLFSELIHFRMKIDEMNYFAAWELAAYNLSDYSDGTEGGGAYNSVDNKFSDAVTKIKKKAQKMYKNLDSADEGRTSGFIMITPDPNSIKVTAINQVSRVMPTPSKRNGENSEKRGVSGFLSGLLSKVDGFVNKVINTTLGKAFGFNTKIIGSQVSVEGSFSISDRFNANAGNRDAGGFSHGKLLQNAMLAGTSTYKPHPFMVWTDTWALKSGEDVINTSTSKSCISWSGAMNCPDELPDFAKQVQRMSLLGTWGGGRAVRLLINTFGTGGLNVLGAIPFIGSLFGVEEQVSEARMISIRYYYDTLDKDYHGNHSISASRGQSVFQTSPVVHVFTRRPQTREGIKEYKATLKKRRNFYMGNNKPYCQFNGVNEQCQ